MANVITILVPKVFFREDPREAGETVSFRATHLSENVTPTQL